MVNNYTIDYIKREGINDVIRVVFSTTQIIDQISVINSHGHIMSQIKIRFDDGSEIERIVDNNDNDIKRYDIFFIPKKITYFDYIFTSETDSNCDNFTANSFKIYEIPYNIRWNFFANRFSVGVEDMRYDDMNKSDNVHNISVGENFQCAVTNRDPGIVYTMEHHLNADKAKYIYTKYRTTCDSENAQIFFVPDIYELEAEERSKTFTIAPNNSSFEYIIDMSDKQDWKGAIRQMRFDPVSYDNQSEKGECFIEYIEINNKKPVYGSQKDFINTQSVNGWSYYTYNQGITYREMMWDEVSNLWKGIKNPELEIKKENQSSIYNFATVRRWTCPANGLYSIKCIFKQISDENLIDFIIKRNHVVLKKYQYDKDSGLSGVYEDKLDMATGEMINFEFCNKDWNMLAVLNIEVIITKEKE